jgi:hypothetical protein
MITKKNYLDILCILQSIKPPQKSISVYAHSWSDHAHTNYIQHNFYLLIVTLHAVFEKNTYPRSLILVNTIRTVMT